MLEVDRLIGWEVRKLKVESRKLPFAVLRVESRKLES
jgi:hypothetical protein